MPVAQKLSDLTVSVVADEDRPGLVLISIGDLPLEADLNEIREFTGEIARASTHAAQLQAQDMHRQAAAFLDRVARQAQ